MKHLNCLRAESEKAMKTTVNLDCCLCSEDIEFQIEVPAKFSNICLGDASCFCEEHHELHKWVDDICRGGNEHFSCVGGWMACSFCNGFTYNEMELSEDELQIVKQGYCPLRTGSVMTWNNGKISKPDANIPGPNTTANIGRKMYSAIMGYRRKYYSEEEK